jgi:hypothetical protein
MTIVPNISNLNFRLEIEDGWPPVGVESLPFRLSSLGYELLSPPLFIKDLSVGDVIVVERELSEISSWRHVVRSRRTTLWLMKLQASQEIEDACSKLRALGCNTSRPRNLPIYAIDVPETVDLREVDPILDQLEPAFVAVAFPSLRH